MAENIFSSYFLNCDCLIVDSRIYNLTYGEKTKDFVKFRGARFGVILGPLLEELEKNLQLQEPEDICRIINPILGELEEASNTNLHRDTLNTDMILKRTAYDAICKYSFKNVLQAHKSETNQADQARISAEDMLKIKKEVLDSLDSTLLQETIGNKNLLILKGASYKLEEHLDIPAKGSIKGVYARVGRKYLTCALPYSLKRILSRYDEKVEKEIRDRLKDNRQLKRSIAGSNRQDDRLENILADDEFYSAENNLGFLKHSEGIFVYTKIPSYILWEHNNNKFYKFPPARVAVNLKGVPPGYIFTSQPLVIEKYKHPATRDTDSPCSPICFEFVEKRRDLISTGEKTFHFLSEACNMLMANYCSDGKAFKNLERPNEARPFSDYLIPESQVDERLVTNRGRCLEAIKDKEKKARQNA